MKAISALYLLKRHGLVGEGFTLRALKLYRRYMTIWNCRTWEDVVRELMLVRYLSGRAIDEPIRVPEVGLSIGGTLRYGIRRVGVRDDGEPVLALEEEGYA